MKLLKINIVPGESHRSTPERIHPHERQSCACQGIVAIRWRWNVNPDRGSGDGLGFGGGRNEGGHLFGEESVSEESFTT